MKWDCRDGRITMASSNRLEAVVPCVEFDDFLQLTLPHNITCVEALTVLTSSTDSATMDVAAKYGAKVLTTDAWWVGGPFNKARALNAWVDRVLSIEEDLWLLVIDADILLPSNRRLELDSLDARGLYSARRRMCEDEQSWKRYRKERLPPETFPLKVPPLRNGKVWGHRPTSNPAGLSGYFHLWKPFQSGVVRFPESPTAGEYDVEFALIFPSHRRRFLTDFDVLHLGMSRVNWQGRTSARWSTARSSCG